MIYTTIFIKQQQQKKKNEGEYGETNKWNKIVWETKRFWNKLIVLVWNLGFEV